jgi:hypothetical protein
VNRLLIDFRVIPHRKQRYDTCGDWFRADGHWFFRVSKLKKQYVALVFLHEIIEFVLCRLDHIKMKEIDRWDMEYEAARATPNRKIAGCGCSFYEEPGDDTHAPYHLAHSTATRCERLIAEALGVNWQQYSDAITGLQETSRSDKKAA